MEKEFIVTKKKVLKNVQPETFKTNQTWINDNKKFMKVHGMTYEEIKAEKEEVIVQESISTKKEKSKKTKETEIADESQEIDFKEKEEENEI
ncbi:MAG: hypothetical protein IPP61_00300 [Cytophagaceae bacterium]|nr:hypothetical protein [Cytophagaceae bacterium]